MTYRPTGNRQYDDVLFCFATLGPRIRVRCAVDDGCIIHDCTEKSRQAPGSYRSTKRNKIQHLIRDTPQDASTPVNGTMSCRSRSPTCWLSKKNTTLTDRSSDKEHESSVVSSAISGEEARSICLGQSTTRILTSWSEKLSRSTQQQKT